MTVVSYNPVITRISCSFCIFDGSITYSNAEEMFNCSVTYWNHREHRKQRLIICNHISNEVIIWGIRLFSDLIGEYQVAERLAAWWFSVHGVRQLRFQIIIYSNVWLRVALRCVRSTCSVTNRALHTWCIFQFIPHTFDSEGILFSESLSFWVQCLHRNWLTPFPSLISIPRRKYRMVATVSRSGSKYTCEWSEFCCYRNRDAHTINRYGGSGTYHCDV